MIKMRMAKSALFVCLGVTLAGCNGSSDGSSVGATAPPEPSSDTSVLTRFFVENFAAVEEAARDLIENDARYVRQQNIWSRRLDTYPLYSSGVYYAHAENLTGKGQIIAISDDGFRISHEVFVGKSVELVGSLPMDEHGTAVAAVAAGDSADMIGMAPDADLLLGGFLQLSDLTATARRAAEVGAVALNNSWGYVVDEQGTTLGVNQTNFDTVFSGGNGQAYLAALTDYTTDGVVVFAASNDASDTTSGLMPALPLLEPDLETGWLAVINADAQMSGDDVIGATRISAPCLEAARWCLAAEGTWEAATATSDTSHDLMTGTSFAAPMVSGALALLGEAFPDMSPNDLRIRLLASADNTFSGFSADGNIELVDGFFHAYSDEWGHGFLDVAAALMPIGETTATMSDGRAYNIATPLAVEGAATGDAVTRALMSVSLAVDDALGGGFAVPADTLVAAPAPAPVTETLWRDWQADTVQTFFPDSRVVGTSDGVATFRVMIPQEGAQDESYGFSLGRSIDVGAGRLAVSFNLGYDDGNLLPSWYNGEGTEFAAGEVAWVAPFGAGTELAVGLGFGSTLGGTGGAEGSALFNSASAALIRRGVLADRDSFSLNVAFPVAVAEGTSAVTLPVRTPTGASIQQDVSVDLAPDEREFQIGFTYNLALSGTSDLTFAAVTAENHGNVSGNRSSGVIIGYRMQF